MFCRFFVILPNHNRRDREKLNLSKRKMEEAIIALIKYRKAYTETTEICKITDEYLKDPNSPTPVLEKGKFEFGFKFLGKLLFQFYISVAQEIPNLKKSAVDAAIQSELCIYLHERCNNARELEVWITAYLIMQHHFEPERKDIPISVARLLTLLMSYKYFVEPYIQETQKKIIESMKEACPRLLNLINNQSEEIIENENK